MGRFLCLGWFGQGGDVNKPKTTDTLAGVWGCGGHETTGPQEFPQILGAHWLGLGHRAYSVWWGAREISARPGEGQGPADIWVKLVKFSVQCQPQMLAVSGLTLTMQSVCICVSVPDTIADSVDVSLSTLWKLVMGREGWHVAVHGVAKSWTRLSNWTELNWPDTISSPLLSITSKRPPFPRGSEVILTGKSPV